MATLSIAQATHYAQAAGFTGSGLRTIVAIAQAESGLNTNAQHVNSDASHSVDRGILQINNLWHAEVTDAQAYNPATAFQAGYTISRGGTDFTPWTTFRTGAYQQTPAWQAGVPTKNVSPTLGVGKWTSQDSLSIWPWITSDGISPNINNPYHSSFEAARGATQDGVGLAVPLDSAVTSLTAGTVMAAAQGQDLAPQGANWNYGGFIVVRSTLPSIGVADVFYRHMDTINVKKGDIVHVGSNLGLSGGQTSGGVHPESPVFTTGAHLDVGINPATLPYTSIGPNLDPTGWLTNLIANGPPIRDRLGLAGSNPVAATAQKGIVIADQFAGGYGPVADNFTAIEARLDESMQFTPIDWSTLSQGTHWWDYALPWQWGNTVNTITGNLAGAVFHDATALAIRIMFVLLGILLVTAFIAGVVLSALTTAAKDTVGTALQGTQPTSGNLPKGDLTPAAGAGADAADVAALA
jgi:murein DD-endopeptidase MepM/ murein hydrolase activator NlpD